MRKILKWGCIAAIAYFLIYSTGLLSDNAQLKNNLIRMHIVANSDSQEDQEVKLKVKDAIVSYLEPAMEKITNKEDAWQYISENLHNLEDKANQVLKDLGQKVTATVKLTREEFDKREYDTFSLPSGVYDSLRVQIGAGEGKNWWCVAFPTLCMPATTDEFSDTAVSSGFSDPLVNTLAEEKEYQVRFFFLDLIGKVEKIFQ